MMTAKRVAIVSSGILSPLNSALEFAKRIKALGYEVSIFAPASAHDLIEHYGFAHHAIPNPRVNAFDALISKEDRRSLQRDGWMDAAIKAFGVDEFAGALLKTQPDIVFIDCEMHAQIIVAMSLNIPVVQYSNMFLSPPGTQAPPLNKRAFPGRGLRGSRPGIALLWCRFLLWKLSKILRKRLSEGRVDYASTLIELARRHDVPLFRMVRLVCWQMPWTYRLPTLLLLPRALDLPTPSRADLTYLGPTILQDRPDHPHDQEKIAQFCEASTWEKRIFVGFGTIMKLDSGLLPNLWAVATNHPDLRFLFAAGQNWDGMAETQLPANVDVVAWAPQQHVLKHADLAIMHGGTGGLVEAVDAGTPMLLYPHVNDQHGSAARVVFHEIGRAGDRNDPVEKIENDIRSLLSSGKVRQNCIQMQALCRGEHSAGDLAGYLRELMSRD